jgi:hypothetical protein
VSGIRAVAKSNFQVGDAAQIGKPKIQIPNPKQIPRSQIPKPGFAFALEFGVWSLFEFWILDFGISRTEWKTFDASALADTNLRFAVSIQR